MLAVILGPYGRLIVCQATTEQKEGEEEEVGGGEGSW